MNPAIAHILRYKVPAAVASSGWTFTDAPAGQNLGVATVTFLGVNIGTASADRIVVVLTSNQGNVASSVTVGGISATKSVEESSVISGLQIWYAAVPTGTTADIVLNNPGGMAQSAIVVGKLAGMTAAPSDNGSGVADSSDPATITVGTVPASGFAIVGYYGTAGGTWTNATFDGQTTTADSNALSMAHTSTSSSTPTYTVGGAINSHLVYTTWGP